MPRENRKYYRIQSNPPNKDLDRFLSLVWYHSLPNEEWREIPFKQEKNFVSIQGGVASIRRNRTLFLQQFICGDRYYCVSIKFDGNEKFTDARINVLVEKAFLPNPENKPIVHHKDTNKQNNKVSNLEWMTTAEHAEAHRQINAKRKKEAPADETLLSTF